ncbi:unnamed protein product [Closterium sp. NIES-65]|nr:unnamed protein product [Closterium sp. NIES-65]CAI6006923.1 unnamed protein product [Closterium sp. NIES-65]
MSAPDQQGQTEEYAGNPIPMTPHQMALLLEEIAKLDTERLILEPGVMLADTGTVLNLNLIRQKALTVGDSSFVGKKRQRMDKPGGPGAPGAPPMKAASGAPRSRVEGRRCEVCAVIKKAGCGTENAHFRCLKRKLPEGAQELERRVGELVDVGKEERVTVWNPKEGRKLSGQAAPMLKNLVGWLASHPGALFPVLPPPSPSTFHHHRKVTNNGSSAPPAQAPAGHHLAPAPAPPASVPVHVPMPVPLSQQDPIPSRT